MVKNARITCAQITRYLCLLVDAGQVSGKSFVYYVTKTKLLVLASAASQLCSRVFVSEVVTQRACAK